MDALATSLTVAGCVLAGGVLGMHLHQLLPKKHLDSETHQVVQLATGMVSVLASLVLGLLIATAKSSFDSTDTAIRTYAADLIMLDETLRDYGDDAIPARRLLRDYTTLLLRDNWPLEGGRKFMVENRPAGDMLEHVREAIRALVQRDEGTRSLQAQAIDLSTALLRQRWRLIENAGPTVRPIAVAILVAWITAIFTSFGLNAPRNATVIGAFAVCALAIGSAIFLVLQLDTPFDGLMRISSQPVEVALAHMLPPGR
jgi:hypothetical protein